MEAASLYIRKVGVGLTGTTSHVIISDARKASHAQEARVFNKETSTKAVEMC